MKKTRLHIDAMKDSGIKCPLVWKVLNENKRFLHIRHRLTGEHRIVRK